MERKCEGFLKNGEPCPQERRGKSKFCCKHGGGICCVPGCLKRARKTGLLCITHFKAKTEDAGSPAVEPAEDDSALAPDDPSGAAEAKACLHCTNVDATFVCEKCNGLLYCETCSLALRRKARTAHKRFRGRDAESFPELPQCPECGVLGDMC